MKVSIGGNCRGLDVIKAAVSQAFDSLPTHTVYGHVIAEITMTNAAGDEMLSADEEEEGERWLEEKLISATIVSIQPQVEP
jgi:hypothetical protein